MIALVLAAATCTTLCDAERLRPFFDKLAQIRGERRTVRILQIGDSHTAGDQVSGAWRAALQARYGNAGRGLLAPGRPYQGYLTKDVTASQSAGWTVTGIFGPAYRGGAGAPVGVSGFSLTAVSAGETLSLAADRTPFDRFTVCALAQPGAGTLQLTFGGTTRAVPLDAPAYEPRCTTLTASAPVMAASLGVTGGPVTVTSWTAERSGGGVELSNVGTVGSQLMHLEREDERIVAAELAQYQPDLIVLAFGTNEAFLPRFSTAGYETRLRAGIGRVKRWAHGAPILLLGAPDSATKLAALQVGEGRMSAPCGGLVDSAMATALPTVATAIGSAWRPTAALAAVQATQRRVAHEFGLAFWDWSAAMGGRCTATRWALATPPLMRPDRVHFTTAGGVAIARALQADLDRAAGDGE